MKGNTEITNCHHEHYVDNKKTAKTFKNLRSSHKLINWGGGTGPPGPNVEPRACPRPEVCILSSQIVGELMGTALPFPLAYTMTGT